MRRTLIRWVAGFGLSLLAIWGITAVATENYYPFVWVEALERNVPAPGWSFDSRTENWARSRFGEWGMAGVEDIAAHPEPKILIWGDSFVQASDVDDDRKMHSRLTGLLAAEEEKERRMIVGAIGRAWWSIPDYYFQIPSYERVVGECRLHVIHLFTLEDVLPDRYPGARVSLFLSEPELHFEKYHNEYHEIEAPAKNNPLRTAAYRARLQFFLRMKRRGLEIARLEGLRFLPEIRPSSREKSVGIDLEWDELKRPDWASEPAPDAAWRFVLEALAEVTEVPILFVYAPVTPTLDGGRVAEENPEQSLVDEFAARCREKGFGFVSLEETFLRYWRASGKFPRGFSTSRPAQGHYNPEGHRLVAEAIHAWIRDNAHVVYPD